MEAKSSSVKDQENSGCAGKLPGYTQGPKGNQNLPFEGHLQHEDHSVSQMHNSFFRIVQQPLDKDETSSQCFVKGSMAKKDTTSVNTASNTNDIPVGKDA